MFLIVEPGGGEWVIILLPILAGIFYGVYAIGKHKGIKKGKLLAELEYLRKGK